MKAKIILLGLAICALMVCCDKEPDPEPDTPVPDYREKWAGVYDAVDQGNVASTLSFAIREGTDSMMDFRTSLFNGHIYDLSVWAFPDGYFSYEGSNAITIRGNFYAEDSAYVYLRYWELGHYSVEVTKELYCVKRKS